MSLPRAASRRSPPALRVLNAVSAPDHAQGVDKRYGPEGFVLNINEPRNLLAHHSDAPSALATLHVEREYQ